MKWPSIIKQKTSDHVPADRLPARSFSLADPFYGWKQKLQIEFIVKGLLVTAAAVGMHHLVMGMLGSHVRNLEYAILQKMFNRDYNVAGRASDEQTTDAIRLPVIIDISNYGPTEPRRGPTDLEKLSEVVSSISAYSPKAIGIDIDFSPDLRVFPER